MGCINRLSSFGFGGLIAFMIVMIFLVVTFGIYIYSFDDTPTTKEYIQNNWVQILTVLILFIIYLVISIIGLFWGEDSTRDKVRDFGYKVRRVWQRPFWATDFVMKNFNLIDKAIIKYKLEIGKLTSLQTDNDANIASITSQLDNCEGLNTRDCVELRRKIIKAERKAKDFRKLIKAFVKAVKRIEKLKVDVDKKVADPDSDPGKIEEDSARLIDSTVEVDQFRSDAGKGAEKAANSTFKAADENKHVMKTLASMSTESSGPLVVNGGGMADAVATTDVTVQVAAAASVVAAELSGSASGSPPTGAPPPAPSPPPPRNAPAAKSTGALPPKPAAERDAHVALMNAIENQGQGMLKPKGDRVITPVENLAIKNLAAKKKALGRAKKQLEDAKKDNDKDKIKEAENAVNEAQQAVKILEEDKGDSIPFQEKMRLMLSQKRGQYGSDNDWEDGK